MNSPATPPTPSKLTELTGQFLPGFAALLACWLAGEVLVTFLPFALPGAIAGMLLLLTFLLLRRRIPQPVEAASHGLLSHLSLLFVPAGVGIIEHGELLRTHGWGLAATLLLSTVVTMAITALTLKALLARRRKDD